MALVYHAACALPVKNTDLPNLSVPPHHTAPADMIHQCDRRIGTGGRVSILLVAPPRINSRIRECPYAPITKRFAFRYVK